MEQNVYHARIEVKQFDSSTGKPLSRPSLQKFEAKGFKDMKAGLERQGYTVDVLYDPTEYNLERRKAQAAVNSRMQQLRAEQAQKQKELEQEALRAELRKEVKAELEAEAKAAAKKK